MCSKHVIITWSQIFVVSNTRLITWAVITHDTKTELWFQIVIVREYKRVVVTLSRNYVCSQTRIDALNSSLRFEKHEHAFNSPVTCS